VEDFLREYESRPEARLSAAKAHLLTLKAQLSIIRNEQKRPLAQSAQADAAIDAAFHKAAETMEFFLVSTSMKDPPVSVGTPVTYTLRTGEVVGTRVAALLVPMTVGGIVQVGTKLEWMDAWVPNSTFGTNWAAPKVPPFVPFSASGGIPRIIIDRDHLGSGTGTSGDPPGLDPKWRNRGHLVPRVLGGPGAASSGNIVAMTHAANALKSGMPGIELALRDDIHHNAAVYEIRVQPAYDLATQIPPVRVSVFARRLYPPSPATAPAYVPSANPYLVHNT
jgi:hypothetical protein